MGLSWLTIDELEAIRLADLEGLAHEEAARRRAAKGRNNQEEVTEMPRGDRTGPAGRGPMTGRGAGYCAGYPVPGFMNPYGDHAPYAPHSPHTAEQGREALQDQVKLFEERIEALKKRIEDLRNEAESGAGEAPD